MDSGFFLLMNSILGFALFAAWRGIEQEKREEAEAKGRASPSCNFM